MREYIVIDHKKMKKSTRIAAVVAGFALIAAGIYMKMIYTAVVGLVILLAVMLQKTISVTEEGVQVTYDAVFCKYRELWRFGEITELHRELSPDRRQCALHFMKDVMSRRLVFSVEDGDEVIGMALEKKEKIHFDEVD